MTIFGGEANDLRKATSMSVTHSEAYFKLLKRISTEEGMTPGLTCAVSMICIGMWSRA